MCIAEDARAREIGAMIGGWIDEKGVSWKSPRKAQLEHLTFRGVV